MHARGGQRNCHRPTTWRKRLRSGQYEPQPLAGHVGPESPPRNQFHVQLFLQTQRLHDDLNDDQSAADAAGAATGGATTGQFLDGLRVGDCGPRRSNARNRCCARHLLLFRPTARAARERAISPHPKRACVEALLLAMENAEVRDALPDAIYSEIADFLYPTAAERIALVPHVS